VRLATAQVVADMFNVKPVRPTGQAGCLLDARARSQLIKAIISALVNLPLFRPGSDVRRRRGPKYIRAAASVRPSTPASSAHATPCHTDPSRLPTSLWQAFVCMRTVAPTAWKRSWSGSILSRVLRGGTLKMQDH